MSRIDNINNYQPLLATPKADQREKLTSRFQTCPSDEESINISLLRQLLAILLAHAAPIDDPCGLRCFFRNSLSQPFPNLSMDFLCLLSGGHFPGANGPDGLICDDNLGPIFRLFRDGFELRGHHLDGLVAFPLLRCRQPDSGSHAGLHLLTSSVSPMHSMTPKPPSSAAFVLLAMNYIQAISCQHCFSYCLNVCSSSLVYSFCHPSLVLATKQARFSYFIFLIKDDSPLAMPAQRPPNVTIFQLLRANLSGKGSIGLVKNILAANFDFFLEVFADEE